MLVRIVPLGNVPIEILEEISLNIRSIFNANSRIMSKIDLPQDAKNHLRRQYDTDKLIDLLVDIPEVKFIEKTTPTLLVTNEDLYQNGLNFVFALEYPDKGILIVSLARLKPEFYNEGPDMSKLKQRAVKESIHVLGHYIGAEHCLNKECIMSYSPSVNDIDTKMKDFCERCKNKLRSKGIYL
ncbi:MAG: archaemetzincin family Zn-dependent metalloprotease [Candidatus Aenigmarchaeota archaeon]|nr:archaemetzincin family Zn-dependent metalloprotease [Candidatus Aenigmarchaeota archaeon]